MKQKGQVFSLDFLVSIVLITIALGLAMQFFELKTTEAKEFTLQTELEQAGNTAVELLANNPAIVCRLVASGIPIGSLSNCLSQTKAVSKNALGLPTAFNCRIEIDGAAIGSGDCRSDATGAANVFSAARTIMQSAADDVSKQQLYYCMDNDAATACGLAKKTVVLKVWKA